MDAINYIKESHLLYDDVVDLTIEDEDGKNYLYYVFKNIYITSLLLKSVGDYCENCRKKIVNSFPALKQLYEKEGMIARSVFQCDNCHKFCYTDSYVFSSYFNTLIELSEEEGLEHYNYNIMCAIMKDFGDIPYVINFINIHLPSNIKYYISDDVDNEIDEDDEDYEDFDIDCKTFIKSRENMKKEKICKELINVFYSNKKHLDKSLIKTLKKYFKIEYILNNVREYDKVYVEDIINEKYDNNLNSFSNMLLELKDKGYKKEVLICLIDKYYS